MENILRAFAKSRAEGKPGAVDRKSSATPTTATEDMKDAPPIDGAEAGPDRPSGDVHPDATALRTAAELSVQTIDEAVADIRGDETVPASYANRESSGPAGWEPPATDEIGADSADQAGLSIPAAVRDEGRPVAAPVGPAMRTAPRRNRRRDAILTVIYVLAGLAALAAVMFYLVQTDPQVRAAWNDFSSTLAQQQQRLESTIGQFINAE